MAIPRHNNEPTINSHLVLRKVREELAVEMGSNDYTTWGIGILCCYHIRETLRPIRCIVRKCVLFNMPVEFLKRGHNVISHSCVIVRVRCTNASLRAPSQQGEEQGKAHEGEV